MEAAERRETCVRLAETSASFVEARVAATVLRNEVLRLSRLLVGSEMPDAQAVTVAGELMKKELARG